MPDYRLTTLCLHQDAFAADFTFGTQQLAEVNACFSLLRKLHYQFLEISWKWGLKSHTLVASRVLDL